MLNQVQHDVPSHPGLDPGSGSHVCTDEIAGRARNDKSKTRNDVPSHPGPDPGSGSSVCTDEIASQACNDKSKASNDTSHY